MGKIDDKTGRRYGRLVVLRMYEIRQNSKGRNKVYWLCKCDCGNEKAILAQSLSSGSTKSCGCYRNEQVAKSKSNKMSEPNGTDRIEINGNIAYIMLTGTKDRMICDVDDLDKLRNSTWSKNAKGYAKCRKKVNGKSRTILAHRIIMNAKDGQIVDHINRNRLDNRKSNLRFVDLKANRINSELRPENKSGYAGVAKQKKSWIAKIMIDGKFKTIGHYKTKEDAITARRKAEKEIYGIYSNNNYME